MSQRQSNPTTADDRSPQNTAGVTLVSPGSNSQLSRIPSIRRVGPQFTEWFPEAVSKLLPTITRAARQLAFEYDPRTLRDERPYRFAAALFDTHGVGIGPNGDLPVHPFNDALAKFAISYVGVDPDADNLSKRQQERYGYTRDEILEVGTRGYPGLPGGLDVLDETLISLLDTSDDTPTIVVSLDGSAWEDVDDERTAGRALDALALLGEVVDVRLVISPRLDAHLERAHPDWYDEHLTEPHNAHHSGGPIQTKEDALTSAWEVVGDFGPESGRLQVLSALDPDHEREVRDLKADAEIEVADGTIGRYVNELAKKHDLVNIDDRPKYNRVSLTEVGTAAQALIGPNDRVLHPSQGQLGEHHTRTRHDSTSRVCCADAGDSPPPTTSGCGCGGGYGGGSGRSGGAGGYSSPSSTDSLAASAPTAEKWLASTGEASGSDHVQWLAGPDDRLDGWEMHERLLAGRRTEGVTLVDEPVEAFEDGKVAYISCFEDHALAVVQWGRPLPTLVRITSALLDEKMWSKVLTPSAIGNNLDELYDGALDDATEDVLRLGAQVGWFSEDEHDYDSFRDRLSKVRCLLLSKLSKLDNSDSTEWNDLCRDAQGLLASATHLYKAVGVDVTINIRIPNTKKLRAGESRYSKFLNCFKHTVAKNASYGVHSVYRLLYEERVDKLKHRMGVEFDGDATADLTASWVVSGPTASTFREDVQQAIASKAEDIRDQIQEGVERGVSLEIPVVDGNSYRALRRVIDRHADRKDFATLNSDERRELVRLASATLGETPGRCSPYALSEALLSIAKAWSPTTSLTPADLAAGLARLPAERLVPSLSPTMQKALKVLLTADESLGASRIVERAGISMRSYTRNIDELAALGMVESVGNGGHKEWQAWIIPWWSPLTDVSGPRTADSDEHSLSPSSRWDDILYELALDLDLDPEYELFVGSVDADEVFAALPELRRWRGFIESHCGLTDIENPSATGEEIDTSPIIEIGHDPGNRPDDQVSLNANV